MSKLLHPISIKQMILKEELVLFKRLLKILKLVFSPLMLTGRTKTFSNLSVLYRHFSCQSHLYMSFPYLECLFHQNNLNLNPYDPEKSFQLEIRIKWKKFFEIKLTNIWSHFKARKIFMKPKIIVDRRFDEKIQEVSISSVPALNSQVLHRSLASNRIKSVCITVVNFPFFLSFFAWLKSSFIIYIFSSLKSSFVCNLSSQKCARPALSQYILFVLLIQKFSYNCSFLWRVIFFFFTN